MKLRTAKKLKSTLEKRWRCKVEIARDWTNYLKIFPEEGHRERWCLNLYLDTIAEFLREVVIYWDFNENCLVIYGKGEFAAVGLRPFLG